MRRALYPLLLLCVAMAGSCDFAPLQAGDPDSAPQPPTEDELLAAYGRRLAGSWTGLTVVTTIVLTEEYAWMNLQWTPDPNTPRSGNLKLRCVTDGADCTPTSGLPGGFSFSYSLYDITEDQRLRGALEFKSRDGEVAGLSMFDLKFVEANRFEFNAPTAVISVSGPFDRDPPPLLDAGTTTAFPNRSADAGTIGP